MKPLGQVDLKPYLLPGLVSAVLTVGSWFGGTTWARWGAAEDMRRTVASHEEELKALRALPVEELRKVPGRIERLERASEQQRDDHERALAEILALLKRPQGVRHASQ